jgi:hypothetical protein
VRNILTIKTASGKKKEVEFNSILHTVVLGYLCYRETGKTIGKVIKTESRP